MTDPEMRAAITPVLTMLGGTLKREVVFSDTRADLIRLTDRIIGYEIKADTDSLWGDRVKKQLVEYNLLCDECWMVIDPDRLWQAESLIPEHWGIITVTPNEVLTVRVAKLNNCISPRCLAESLWLDEINDILKENGMKAAKPKREAVKIVCKVLKTDQLRAAVISRWLARKEDVTP